MEKLGKILIIDDNEDVLFALRLLLDPLSEKVVTSTSPSQVESLLARHAPDIILLDMNFSRDAESGREGMEVLEQILRIDPQAVVIFITAYADTEKAVAAVKAGAMDFIPKPWKREKLLATLGAAMELSRSRHEVKRLKAQVELFSHAGDAGEGCIVGESEAMQKVLETLRHVSQTDANILLLGENGTGKDVLARFVHRASPRANNPFVAIDLGGCLRHCSRASCSATRRVPLPMRRTPRRGVWRWLRGARSSLTK